jgi:VanZ family protein
MKKFPFIYWLPVLFYYAFITYLSGTSPHFDPAMSDYPHLDKIYHTIEYTFFGLVLSRDLFWQQIFFSSKRRWFVKFLVFTLCLIVLDEFHQHFTPNRSVDFFDGVADMCGSLLGACLFVYVIRGRKFDATPGEKLRRLKERDKRFFALFLVPILSFIVITINSLNIKLPLATRYPLLDAVFTFLEWTVLGFIIFRASTLWLLGKHKKILIAVLMLCALPMSVVAYALILEILNIQPLEPMFCLKALFFAVIGALFSGLRLGFHRLNQRVEFEPSFKRHTWQRSYYFYPAMILAFWIVFFSWLPPNNIAKDWRHFERVEVFLSSLSFLVFGVFFFRAVSWEAWWHEKTRRVWIWLAALMMTAALIALSVVLRGIVPERHLELWSAVFNSLAILVSLVIYRFGFRLIKLTLIPETRRPSYTKIHNPKTPTDDAESSRH